MEDSSASACKSGIANQPKRNISIQNLKKLASTDTDISMHIYTHTDSEIWKQYLVDQRKKPLPLDRSEPEAEEAKNQIDPIANRIKIT